MRSGYHWEERDLSAWAKQRIQELIVKTVQVKKGLAIKYLDVAVEGQVCAPQRIMTY